MPDSNFSSYMEQIRAEYEKSPLLKYTLPAIFVILSLYIADALWQRSNELSDEYSGLLVQEGKITSLHEQADWQLALEKAQNRLDENAQRIWTAESLELASADLQTELRVLTKERVIALRISMSPPERLGTSDMWSLSAEVTGKFLTSEVPSLLFDLAVAEPALSIDRFSYLAARSQTGALQISALFSIDAPNENTARLAQ